LQDAAAQQEDAGRRTTRRSTQEGRRHAGAQEGARSIVAGKIKIKIIIIIIIIIKIKIIARNNG
jgi:hypothetical protein